MQEHHFTIPRTARYYTLGTPSHEIKRCWIVLHGYGMLAGRFLRWFEPLQADDQLIVAPEGMHRFYREGFSGKVGASWMTKEDRLTDISDYVKYLDELRDRVVGQCSPDTEVVVLGFSQGAATASRWVCMGEHKPDQCVLWAGVFPPDLPPDLIQERFNQLPVYTLLGDQDEFIDDNRAKVLLQELETKGIAYHHIPFKGTHRVEPEAIADLVSAMEAGFAVKTLN